ncbi:MAG TPA: AmmeMemoRadiSam system protein B [Candidatus Kryptonia bacterium]
MNRFSVVSAAVLFQLVSVVYAQDIKPIRDNVGFCWDPVQMTRLIDYLKKIEKEHPMPAKIVAAISPHDDYLYAARVYYPLYRTLRAKEVVIFGVTHGDVRSEIGDPHNILILDNYKEWPGLVKDVGISPLREYIKAHLDTSYFIVSYKAHALEHSIEALVPFIQYFNPDAKIVPIMVTQMPFGRMDTISDHLSSIISDYIKVNHLVPGKDIAFLVSSDADHYGPDFNNSPYGEDEKAHAEATANDRRIAHKDLDGVLTSEKVYDLTNEMKNTLWCGKFSVPFGLLTSEKVVMKTNGKELDGKLIRYSDSYSEGVIPLKGTGMGTTAPASYKHWCGWLSEAFYLK